MKNLLIFLIIFNIGCSQQQIKEKLKDVYYTKIHIPTNLITIRNGIVSDDISSEAVYLAKLLIYFSSEGCTPCKVSHISDLDTLFNMGLGINRFTPQVIISPSPKQFEDIITQVKFQNHDYPIYVDKDSKFRQLNHHLPDDTRYHTFLLDKNNRVVLVGNPLTSDAMWSLFKSTLDNMLAHDGVYVPEK